MDTSAAARRWVQEWTRGWQTHDPDVIAQLYAEDATFRSHPFRDLVRGPKGAWEYARRAFAEEEQGADIRFGEPIVAGHRAAVEYWATFCASGGEDTTLAGVTVLRFDDDGLVTDHLDYWATAPGHRPTPHS